MPELPDIVIYLEALDKRILGETLTRITLGSPFLLRTAAPPLVSVHGQKIVALRRVGKRICFGFANDFWLVLHLMIAGRLQWKDDARKPTRKNGTAKLPNKRNLATFEFGNGTLSLTEAGTQRRASLHLVAGEAALKSLDPGGLEIFESDLSQFASVLQSANHTLKRALTDPRLFSGIGNAYSDEILWHARLSPIALTQKLRPEEIECLFNSTRALLTEWVELLRADAGGKFPEKVTAFRPEMAVHGKYQEPCPRCGSKVRRIRYAANETNYCPTCQTGGKLLADRALSRLLRADWPRSEEELM
ncbi:MAG TPA: DNA-formamidopyrimidine glycosylase family protein [Pyrinomonadaceae bacterium]|nr:DNA-formamidopyrimidine glycosylase family protein [Pyrinomonadaceae bacterium]